MMTIDEVMGQLPAAPQMVSVYTPDGATAVQGVLATAPEPAEVSDAVRAEFGNLPVIMMSWDADTEYTLFWPVESIEQDGPIIRVKGPKGLLELRRRP